MWPRHASRTASPALSGVISSSDSAKSSISPHHHPLRHTFPIASRIPQVFSLIIKSAEKPFAMKAFNYFPPNQQVYSRHCETRANVQKRFAGEGRSPPLPGSDISVVVSLLVSSEIYSVDVLLSESVSDNNNKTLSDLSIVSSSYLKNCPCERLC